LSRIVLIGQNETTKEKVYFFGDEIKSAKITKQIDSLCADIYSSVLDITIDQSGKEEPKDVTNILSNHDSWSLEVDSKEIFHGYLTDKKRISQRAWSISLADYFQKMDEYDFAGFLYFVRKAGDPQGVLPTENEAKTKYVLSKIVDVGLGYTVDTSNINDDVLIGLIKPCTAREALAQVCMAIGMFPVAEKLEDGTRTIKFKNVGSVEDAVQIPKSRVMQGQKADEDRAVSSVDLKYHEFSIKLDDAYVEKVYVYKEIYRPTEEDVGKEILVTFDDPVWDVYPYYGEYDPNEGPGIEIIEKKPTYAKIKVKRSYWVLMGGSVSHKKTSYSKQTQTNQAYGGVAKVEDATLVNKNNVDSVWQRCYNYFSAGKTSVNIIDRKEIKYLKYGDFRYGEKQYGFVRSENVETDKPLELGQVVNVDGAFGSFFGVIEKQTTNIVGNQSVKDTEIKKVVS
jgi:hypothetical protein